MQTEVHKDASEAAGQNVNTCPNCHTLMPSEMRFCRACGCRLGEGVEEYTETVRFDSAPRATGAPRAGNAKTAEAARAWTSPTGVREWGTVARSAGGQAVRSVATGLKPWKMARACSRRVPKWMIWVFLPIFVFSIIGGMNSNRRLRVNKGSDAATAAGSNSYLGAHYKTSQGGAFIQDVTPPGSAADKAGLVGGDVITSFDGKTVKSESDLTNFLTNTPTGKTVDVTFIRDGETKTIKLTTISQAENDRLEEAFDDGPKGFLGVEDDFKRVQVANSNLYGVQIHAIKNRPGYIAGLRDGDIVIEFNGALIRTPEELNTRIDRAAPDSTVKVVVMRGSERQEITVKMGEDD